MTHATSHVTSKLENGQHIVSLNGAIIGRIYDAFAQSAGPKTAVDIENAFAQVFDAPEHTFWTLFSDTRKLEGVHSVLGLFQQSASAQAPTAGRAGPDLSKPVASFSDTIQKIIADTPEPADQ